VGTETIIKQCDTFPSLRNEEPIIVKKYVTEIQLHQQELNSHFQDIGTYEVTINLILMLFDVHVQSVPTEFQTEMTQLLCCMILRYTMV
jgi:hypothetical protein